jgi:hypothetical protein
LHHIGAAIIGTDLIELFADGVAVLWPAHRCFASVAGRNCAGCVLFRRSRIRPGRVSPFWRAKVTRLCVLRFGSKIITDEPQLDGIGRTVIVWVVFEAVALEILH